jgi:D-sedoheptulose 7-phosphate isomerase
MPTDLREAILRKSRESAATMERFFRENADRISACAFAMAGAFERGARLFVMGNGGSLCDAQHATVEFMHPVLEKRRALPAITLASETALLTAVANDQDFSLAFATQLRLLARKGDIALAISTSGKSAGVARALKAAREMELLTIGFTGRDGGQMTGACDHCFVVPSFSIHRIQETHGALLHILWDAIHLQAGEEDLL